MLCFVLTLPFTLSVSVAFDFELISELTSAGNGLLLTYCSHRYGLCCVFNNGLECTFRGQEFSNITEPG